MPFSAPQMVCDRSQWGRRRALDALLSVHRPRSPWAHAISLPPSSHHPHHCPSRHKKKHSQDHNKKGLRPQRGWFRLCGETSRVFACCSGFGAPLPPPPPNTKTRLLGADRDDSQYFYTHTLRAPLISPVSSSTDLADLVEKRRGPTVACPLQASVIQSSHTLHPQE